MSGWRRALVTAVAPALVALAVSLVVLAVVLTLLGVDPVTAVRGLFDFGATDRARANQWRSWVNGSVPLFLSGLAVSIGFRTNLFNIGVEGQYRVAAVVAAAAGAAVTLPRPLHLAWVVAVAMVTGAAYAAIPAVLKVWRGVNEVITTIMLNSIAGALIAYLLRVPFRPAGAGPGQNTATAPLPESARLPGFADPFALLGLPAPSRPVGGFVVVAGVVGVLVALLVSRTRFGFGLRASGRNATAAAVGGVRSRRMVLQAMLLSGALAGLVGLPQVLGEDYAYGVSFTAGLGFSGIAVALLGRSAPIGIALAAVLFAFLDRAGPSLQRLDVPPSVVTITQGVIVLSVVVVDEVARWLLLRAEDRRVGAVAGPPDGPAPGPGQPSPAAVPS